MSRRIAPQPMVIRIAVRRTVTQVSILVVVIIPRPRSLPMGEGLDPTTDNSVKSVSSLRSH